MAKARLLIVRQDGDTRVVEVAHEALLRNWPLLRSWLDAAREFLIGRQQLEQDLRDWEQAAETEKIGALLTGLKLNRARGWLIEHSTQLTAQQRGFIRTSIKRAKVEQDRIDEERRSKERTQRIITWGSIAAAVLFAVFAAVALFERNSAQREQVRAEGLATATHIQLLAIQARRSDADASTPEDIGLAGALAWRASH